MNKLTGFKFEKVSKAEYDKVIGDPSCVYSQCYENLYDQAVNNPKCICDPVEYDNIKLPTRATTGSCGYDFYSPVKFTLPPTQVIKIPTFVKVKLPESFFLMVVPRSSFGTKYLCSLTNTVGIIDSDYYGNVDNDGHIWLNIINNGSRTLEVNVNDRLCQGIALPSFCTEDEYDPNNFFDMKERVGGFGSTGINDNNN